jgi:hypothetical protein
LDSESILNWFWIDSELIQIQFRIDTESIQYRFRTDSEPNWNWKMSTEKWLTADLNQCRLQIWPMQEQKHIAYKFQVARWLQNVLQIARWIPNSLSIHFSSFATNQISQWRISTTRMMKQVDLCLNLNLEPVNGCFHQIEFTNSYRLYDLWMDKRDDETIASVRNYSNSKWRDRILLKSSN